MRRGGPLVHFLVLGALLFAAARYLNEAPAEPDVWIRARDISSIEQDWIARMGRAPSEAELASLIERRVDDELMLRQAFALGWHRSDGVVVRRLILNQRFLDPESEADDAEMLDRAYAQGMDRSDIVVRRRLLERLRLSLAEIVRREEPSDEALRAYLEAHREHFMRSEAIRVTHVFLSRDRRGAALDEDARLLGERIRREALTPEAAVALGDPLLIAQHLPLWSQDQLARRLGLDFARGAFEGRAGQWKGPVPSSYGLHFVWIHERTAARLPELDEVRAEVRGAVLQELEQAALERHLAELRRGALIVVEARPTAGT